MKEKSIKWKVGLQKEEENKREIIFVYKKNRNNCP